MEILDGKITKIGPEGITVLIPSYNLDRACLRQYDAVQVGLPDGRTISPEQRRKAYALMGEIADWSGNLPTYVKRLMKMKFVVEQLQALEKDLFSLSNCDVTTAREFITYLIDFMIEHDVPSKTPLQELCEDITRYVYACLMHKKCIISGKKAELHHAEDRVGMGRNRKKIIHEGMRVMPLSREYHMECHTMSQEEFNNKYHIVSVVASKEICKKWGLKYECE